MRGKAIPCILMLNGPKDGYTFAPIECKSISEALKTARGMELPYRIYDREGRFLCKGWIVG